MQNRSSGTGAHAVAAKTNPPKSAAPNITGASGTSDASADKIPATTEPREPGPAQREAPSVRCNLAGPSENAAANPTSTATSKTRAAAKETGKESEEGSRTIISDFSALKASETDQGAAKPNTAAADSPTINETRGATLRKGPNETTGGRSAGVAENATVPR